MKIFHTILRYLHLAFLGAGIFFSGVLVFSILQLIITNQSNLIGLAAIFYALFSFFLAIIFKYLAKSIGKKANN